MRKTLNELIKDLNSSRDAKGELVIGKELLAAASVELLMPYLSILIESKLKAMIEAIKESEDRDLYQKEVAEIEEEIERRSIGRDQSELKSIRDVEPANDKELVIAVELIMPHLSEMSNIVEEVKQMAHLYENSDYETLAERLKELGL